MTAMLVTNWMSTGPLLWFGRGAPLSDHGEPRATLHVAALKGRYWQAPVGIAPLRICTHRVILLPTSRTAAVAPRRQTAPPYLWPRSGTRRRQRPLPHGRAPGRHRIRISAPRLDL